eukprot:TRINITY_DN3299_c0_g1_i3.p4 TRINITY_DN3299_c0_g1~~TRINITY_DN3299_c0_g1_i3.p4  ORF type:complete len:121 (-),score=8.99 TRINITY_DN3299_c0_g1_i3:422-784(-)
MDLLEAEPLDLSKHKSDIFKTGAFVLVEIDGKKIMYCKIYTNEATGRKYSWAFNPKHGTGSFLHHLKRCHTNLVPKKQSSQQPKQSQLAQHFAPIIRKNSTAYVRALAAYIVMIIQDMQP